MVYTYNPISQFYLKSRDRNHYLRIGVGVSSPTDTDMTAISGGTAFTTHYYSSIYF